jgi:AmmeMemoRadiSam system protein B
MTVDDSDYDKLVLIVPNHPESGSRPIISSSSWWDTPTGRITTDSELLKKLDANDLLGINDDVVDKEHAVVDLLPYLSYFFPDKPVTFLIVSNKSSMNELMDIKEVLVEYMRNEKVLIVAAVDFSHYLTTEEAMQKDRETIAHMRAHDYQTLYVLGNDHLDTPKGMVLFLSILKSLGWGKIEVWDQGNSGFMLGDLFGQTTSYIVAGF